MADWVAIKTEYVTGEDSLQELAQKYGISQSTLRKRSANESWVEQREEHRNNLGTLVEQKTAEKIAESESEIASLKSKARLKIWKEIERRMADDVSKMDNADLRRMVQNYCDMHSTEPEDSGPADTAKEDDLSRSLKELGKELESDEQ